MVVLDMLLILVYLIRPPSVCASVYNIPVGVCKGASIWKKGWKKTHLHHHVSRLKHTSTNNILDFGAEICSQMRSEM
jgi:hypothetical protein